MILNVLMLLVTTLVCTVLSQLEEDEVRFTSTVCAESAGCMRGRLMPGYSTPFFEAFLGVPYALPPLGDLRFRSPREYPKWQDTLDALEAKADCIQKNYLLPNYPVAGREDCLYLNVYRPLNTSECENLPVMVYIYGGGWFSGTSNPAVTGPEYIMDTKKVIMVTFNYRLGAFGFLSTGDEVIPGNFGLKDQLLALKWVQKNIKAFGGDPAKVTLFGQSAGAVSAHMHVLSPQSQGLFQGVIAASGTANVPFAINDSPLEQALDVAELCGIENAKSLSRKDLLKALQAVDHDTLLRAGDGLKFWSVDHLTNFRPVVERTNVRDAFLTKHPAKILKSGSYQAVPLMLGTVPLEGAVRALAILESNDLRESFNRNFSSLLQTFLEFPKYMCEQDLEDKMQRIIEDYFQGERELNNVTRQGFVDLITERGFHHSLYNMIKDYINTVDTQAHPIYLYNFNYTGPHSYSTLYTGDITKRHYGVVHCDDLIYLLRSPLLFEDFPKNSTYAQAVQLFVNNFVHFAQFQRPMPTPALKSCNAWTFERKPQSICDYQLFTNHHLDEASIVLQSNNKFNVQRMKFWDEILNK